MQRREETRFVGIKVTHENIGAFDGNSKFARCTQLIPTTGGWNERNVTHALQLERGNVEPGSVVVRMIREIPAGSPNPDLPFSCSISVLNDDGHGTLLGPDGTGVIDYESGELAVRSRGIQPCGTALTADYTARV